MVKEDWEHALFGGAGSEKRAEIEVKDAPKEEMMSESEIAEFFDGMDSLRHEFDQALEELKKKMEDAKSPGEKAAAKIEIEALEAEIKTFGEGVDDFKKIQQEDLENANKKEAK